MTKEPSVLYAEITKVLEEQSRPPGGCDVSRPILGGGEIALALKAAAHLLAVAAGHSQRLDDLEKTMDEPRPTK